ncbi:hypothetical protein CYMTET_13172 [Cymbomonas tetramitiformis]|uniref:Uncharacterized protein n=1 Tax=Cymbomonas tetramitiformis TaxID=36881 RepID=A0AAE0GJ05_9CHLO|nr:hypothetical protein CYMTET_13172 [Cymbomonas tetramitiformis]
MFPSWYTQAPHLTLYDHIFGVSKANFSFGSDVCSFPGALGRKALQRVRDDFEDLFLKGILGEARLTVDFKGQIVLDTWGCRGENISMPFEGCVDRVQTVKLHSEEGAVDCTGALTLTGGSASLTVEGADTLDIRADCWKSLSYSISRAVRAMDDDVAGSPGWEH